MAEPTQVGIAGWGLWAIGEFVARRGIDHPERALQTLHAITQRFTAEWAIRPFIVKHPQVTYATLTHWSQDSSAHVRRLVSEGSRPRLPWGALLKGVIADPSPNLPLLVLVQNDSSAIKSTTSCHSLRPALNMSRNNAGSQRKRHALQSAELATKAAQINAVFPPSVIV